MSTADCPYVSRGGLKLEAALRAFAMDVRGWVCADFGSHVGGFVDCLLQHGAARVYAVEPGYGVLAWSLRRDPRVVVCERASALSWTAPEPCDLVTVDCGWTPLRLTLPAIRRALKTEYSCAVLLVKPQYEAERGRLRRGVVPDEALPEILGQVRQDARDQAWLLSAECESPLRGHGGNREYLWLMQPLSVSGARPRPPDNGGAHDPPGGAQT